MIEIGKVYKNNGDNSLTRTPIFEDAGRYTMKTVIIDLNNNNEVQLDTATNQSWVEDTNSINTNWELVEDIDVYDEVKAYVLAKYP